MEITLAQSSWDFLKKNILPLTLGADEIVVLPILPSSKDPRQTTGRLIISLSEEVAEQVIDSLTNFLCSRGLRSDGEPNSVGLHVEDFINIFTNGLHSVSEMIEAT